MRKYMRICMALAAAAGTAATLSSSSAFADYSNEHAAACMTFGGVPALSNGVVHNTSSTDELILVCPIPDNTAMPGSTITLVRVYGFDGNNNGVQPSVRNCSAGNLPSFSCAAVVTSGPATGQFDLAPPIPASWSAIGGEYRYTHVSIPRADGSSESYLRGVFVSN